MRRHDAGDLVLADQPLGILLRALRVGLVEPDEFGRAPQQHVVALLQRQHAPLSEIFRLVDDIAGLGPDHADLDRLGRGGVADIRHAQPGGDQAGGAERARAEKQAAAPDRTIEDWFASVGHDVLPCCGVPLPEPISCFPSVAAGRPAAGL